MKRDSTEFTILQSLNSDEIRSDPWNPAPNLLYTAERGDDAILCFERLFGCDNPPLQTVANVIDYIRQALEVTHSILLKLTIRTVAALAPTPSPSSLTGAMLTKQYSGPVFSPRAQYRTSRIWRPKRRDDGHRPPDHGRL